RFSFWPSLHVLTARRSNRPSDYLGETTRLGSAIDLHQTIRGGARCSVSDREDRDDTQPDEARRAETCQVSDLRLQGSSLARRKALPVLQADKAGPGVRPRPLAGRSPRISVRIVQAGTAAHQLSQG